MYKVAVFIPADYLDVVKTAMFDAGAGKFAHYDNCSWQALGEGQFRPLAGSQPFIGEEGSIEKVSEWKVEMVCEDAFIKDVITAMKAAHPYEEPAYDMWPLTDVAALHD